MRIRRTLKYFIIAMLAAGSSSAYATDWIAGNAAWPVPGNWSAGVPSNTVDGVINNGSTANITTPGQTVRALSVGTTGTGTLAISGGGVLTGVSTANGTGTLGTNAGSSGTVTIDGAGSAWNITGALKVGNSGSGTLQITNGGLLNASGAVSVAALAGSTGSLSVDGAGSRFTGNGNIVLSVGGGGSGTMEVTNGGVVTGTGMTTSVGALLTGTGTLRIRDAGSTMTIGNLFVGNLGSGDLFVENGGVLISGNSTVGNGSLGVPMSSATIDGAGSRWNAGTINIGIRGNGNLTISNGAVVNSTAGTIGARGATATATMDNGTWNVTGSINSNVSVGTDSTGTLNVLNGSVLNIASRLTVGSGTGTGTMLVDNAAVTLLPGTAETVEIGTGGIATNARGFLTVRNGSTMTFNTQFQLGSRGTGNEGTAIVQDAGTNLIVTGGFTVGQNGTGHFQLLNGATANTGSFASAGNGGAAPSDILVDNASWSIAGLNPLVTAARLGIGGVTTMTIQNGATVDITNGGMDIAQNAGSSGTLTIGGTGGTFTATQVVGGKTDHENGDAIVPGGTATLNFAHTNAGQVFAPRIRGNITVNQMNIGTTILTGDGDHTGNTNVLSGIYRAGVTDAFSENSDYVVTGGRLELNNLDNEIGSLAGTGDVILGTGTLTTGSTASTAWSGDISGTGGLTKTGASIFLLETAQSYTGATIINRGAIHAGAQDVITASSGLTVNTGGRFHMGGFDQTIGELQHFGLIDFGLVRMNNLTVTGNLDGAGLFLMNTNLEAGTGDHIDVQGTSAGNHILAILNEGGTPADPAQALEVVSTTDGVARFRMPGDSIDVGLYAYGLMQGNGSAQLPNANNWYLANLREPSEGARAILNTAAGMSNTWFTQLDNLHRRMGQQRLTNPAAQPYEVWVRGYNRKIEVDESVSGKPFDEKIRGIDIGIDKVVSATSRNTWLAGAFAGYGWTDRKFNDVGSHGDTTTPYAGLYMTWFNKNNIYVDTTFKVQRFRNGFDAVDDSGNHHLGEYAKWATGGTAEIAKRFMLGDQGWSIQPQAQVGYVYLIGDDYTTARGTTVKSEGDNVLQLRAGLEGGKNIRMKNGGILYPYIRTSVVEEKSYGGKLKTDDLEWNPNLDGRSMEYGAGLIYQLDKQRQGYVTVLTSSGDHYDQPWGINAGFRYEF